MRAPEPARHLNSSGSYLSSGGDAIRGPGAEEGPCASPVTGKKTGREEPARLPRRIRIGASQHPIAVNGSGKHVVPPRSTWLDHAVDEAMFCFNNIGQANGV